MSLFSQEFEMKSLCLNTIDSPNDLNSEKLWFWGITAKITTFFLMLLLFELHCPLRKGKNKFNISFKYILINSFFGTAAKNL